MEQEQVETSASLLHKESSEIGPLSKRNKLAFGCILCDRKGEVKNIEGPKSQADHIMNGHGIGEYTQEIDIERVDTV